jgi:sugar/nucleoside kinase (ribokinase family)
MVGTDVVCVGEALWDLRTPTGITLDAAETLHMSPGGGAVNTALRLSELGLSAALCTIVGDDAVGEALVTRLSARGLDVSRVARARARTGLVLLQDAPPRVVAYRRLDEEARAMRSSLPARWEARAVHISGLLPSRSLITAIARAMRRARTQGCLVTADANLRPRLWRDAKVDPLQALAEADVVQVSSDDLRVLGLDVAALRSRLPARTTLIVTAGREPARALGPFGEIARPTQPLVAHMPLGAGDAFAAGVLAALLDVRPEDRSTAALLGHALERGHAIARAAITAAI